MTECVVLPDSAVVLEIILEQRSWRDCKEICKKNEVYLFEVVRDETHGKLAGYFVDTLRNLERNIELYSNTENDKKKMEFKREIGSICSELKERGSNVINKVISKVIKYLEEKIFLDYKIVGRLILNLEYALLKFVHESKYLPISAVTWKKYVKKINEWIQKCKIHDKEDNNIGKKDKEILALSLYVCCESKKRREFGSEEVRFFTLDKGILKFKDCFNRLYKIDYGSNPHFFNWEVAGVEDFYVYKEIESR